MKYKGVPPPATQSKCSDGRRSVWHILAYSQCSCAQLTITYAEVGQLWGEGDPDPGPEPSARLCPWCPLKVPPSEDYHLPSTITALSVAECSCDIHVSQRKCLHDDKIKSCGLYI